MGYRKWGNVGQWAQSNKNKGKNKGKKVTTFEKQLIYSMRSVNVGYLKCYIASVLYLFS